MLECHEVSLFKIFFFVKLFRQCCCMAHHLHHVRHVCQSWTLLELLDGHRSPIFAKLSVEMQWGSAILGPKFDTLNAEDWVLCKRKCNWIFWWWEAERKRVRSMPDNIIWSQVKSIFLFNESARFKPLKSKDFKC